MFGQAESHIFYLMDQCRCINKGFPDGSAVKEFGFNAETQEMQVRCLGQEALLEKEMATLSSILAWKMPWTEEPDGLQSMGLQRFRHY